MNDFFPIKVEFRTKSLNKLPALTCEMTFSNAFFALPVSKELLAFSCFLWQNELIIFFSKNEQKVLI